MDGREGGYIKAYRQWESSAAVLALSAEGEVVWLRLLFAANWKDSEVILRTGPHTIKRGQALIAERTLAERARVGRKVVRTALEKLTLAGCITVSKVASIKGPSVNLVTVLNYDRFQADEETEAQGRAQARPKVGPRSAQSEEGEEGEEDTSASKDAGAGASLFALDGSPGPKKNGRAKRKGDPTIEALKDYVLATYREAKGEELRWPPSAYGQLQAIRDTLADDEEVKRRWSLFLADKYWPNKTVHKFEEAYQHAKYQRPKVAAAPTPLYKPIEVFRS